MKKIILSILLFSFSIVLFSQSSMEFKLMLVGMHPDRAVRQNPLMYENRMDDNGTFIFEPGLMFSYQKYIYLTTLSLQFSQCIFSDAAAQLAGSTSMLLKYRFFHKYKFALEFGMGPSLSFRQDWNNINQYVENDGYIVNGHWQTKMMLGAELTAYVYLGGNSDISLSVHHGSSYGAASIALGYRHWFNSIANVRTNCNDCGNKFSKGKFRHWWKRHVW
jgi:hypothetical protein